MSDNIVNVKDLLKVLGEYDGCVRVFYSTRYALVPLSVKLVEEDILVFDMSDEAKKSFERDID